MVGISELPGVDELCAPLAGRGPELSWQGLETREDRDAFLGSTAAWCDLPLRAGGPTGVQTALAEGEPVDLEELLGELAQIGKGIRLELTEGGPLVGRLLRTLERTGFPIGTTRLLGSYDTLGADGFAQLAEAARGSVECAADYLEPLQASEPRQFDAVLGRLAGLGIGRVAVRSARRGFLEALSEAGFEVDLRDLGTLRALLDASGSGVRSMATDFGLAQRPTLRHSVDAAMGQGPPVARPRPRLRPVRRSSTGRPVA